MAGRLVQEKGIYRSRHWAALRRRVLARDGYCCRRCGNAARFEVHHIKPVAHGGKNELGNLETLCRGCHIGETRTQKTKRWRDPDWEALVRRETGRC